MAVLALLSFVNYTFTYPEGDRPALDRITFSLNRGEILLLCGPTGSGKTTLLRSMKAETVPAGREEGEVFIRDCPRSGTPENFTVGYVAQDPTNQIVMDTVWHELAFGLENLGLPSPVIRRRMAETANFFGIEDWIEKKVSALSGGQKQLLNLASVLAMQPDLLLLDEPTAQLDPIASKEFLQMVRRINRELGITVVLSEHRLEDALPMADQVAYLEEGKLLHFCPPEEFVRCLYRSSSSFTLALPAAAQIAHRLTGGQLLKYPLSVREGRRWLEEAGVSFHNGAAAQRPSEAEKVLWARELWYRYDRTAPFVIRDGELQLQRGEIYAIVGGNGSGKTTLLHLLSGVFRPSRGRVWRDPQSRVGLLSQNPKSLFTADTLREEMMELSASNSYGETEAAAMLERLGLSRLAERHPYDLSGGEMQKAALAKILLLSPRILLLDEPTKGLDAAARKELREILLQLRAEGRSLLLVTHDLDFAASVSDRCSMLFDGGILSTDAGKQFFAANLFYTTETNRMTRNLMPRQPEVFTQACVTVEDVAAGSGTEDGRRGSEGEPDWQGGRAGHKVQEGKDGTNQSGSRTDCRKMRRKPHERGSARDDRGDE